MLDMKFIRIAIFFYFRENLSYSIENSNLLRATQFLPLPFPKDVGPNKNRSLSRSYMKWKKSGFQDESGWIYGIPYNSKFY